MVLSSGFCGSQMEMYLETLPCTVHSVYSKKCMQINLANPPLNEVHDDPFSIKIVY